MSCHWCHGDCGGTCLGLTRSAQMKTSDPAYFLLADDRVSTPEVFKAGCYICEDPEFARMGLPLCSKCPLCGGHVAADDTACDTEGCTYDAYEAWREQGARP